MVVQGVVIGYTHSPVLLVLQAMGISASECDDFTDDKKGAPVKGYGLHSLDPSRVADHEGGPRQNMGKPLP